MDALSRLRAESDMVDCRLPMRVGQADPARDGEQVA